MSSRLLFACVLPALAAACGERHLAHLDPGRLVVDPPSLDFGELETLSQADHDLTLTNVGKAAVTVTAKRIEGPATERFSTDVELPLTIEGGASATLTVLYRSGPVSSRDEATLTLELDGAEDDAVDVTLTGAAKEGLRPRWIAFDSNRNGGNLDLYAIRSDGSELKRLTTDDWNDLEPAFSHDGKQLAFASDRVDFTMNIFVMDLATKQIRQVTSAAQGSRQPSWSVDDKRLAFHRGIGVYTIALDGTDEVHVIDGLNELNVYQHPSYLPGGQWLVVDRGNQIDLIRPDGTDLRNVVQNDTTSINTPSPSPTGATVAFAINCGGGFSVRSVPTSSAVNGCTGASEVQFPGRHPAWGPELIAYETDEANSEIMVVPATGGPSTNLSRDAASDRNPTWAPEGTQLP